MKASIVVMLAAALTVHAREQAPRFAVDVEGVQVDVQVTRRGRPVAGLTPNDFELRDNGVVQTIETVTREDVPLDLFLVLDASASVAGGPLEALSNAARIAVQTLARDDRAALVTFTHRVREAAPLTPDRTAVLTAIAGMKASGATSLLDALYATMVLRDSSPRRVLMLVFTDGYDTSSWLTPSAVSELARQTDAVIYGVTLTPPDPPHGVSIQRTGPPLPAGASQVITAPRPYEPPPFLNELAALTGGRVFHTSSPRKLQELFGTAVREMKARYVLTYTPRGVAREGWHTIQVRLARKRGDVTARRGYFVPSPQ